MALQSNSTTTKTGTSKRGANVSIFFSLFFSLFFFPTKTNTGTSQRCANAPLVCLYYSVFTTLYYSVFTSQSLLLCLYYSGTSKRGANAPQLYNLALFDSDLEGPAAEVSLLLCLYYSVFTTLSLLLCIYYSVFTTLSLLPHELLHSTRAT